MMGDGEGAKAGLDGPTLRGGSSTVMRRVARRLLPLPVRRRLIQWASGFEAKRAPAAINKVCAGRSVPLKDVQPQYEPGYFADGPIILINNALAWGGAERQVVAVLKGIASLIPRQIGLLCLRLGTVDHDFFLPALKDFPGIVRNVMDAEAADKVMARLPAASAAYIRAVISWLPNDVQDEIQRMVAEFIELRPSVVHAWQDASSISVSYAGRLSGVPRIMVSGRNVSPPNFAYCRPYMAPAYRELAAVRDIIMMNNSEAGAADYARWLGLRDGRIQVVRNGIDPLEFPTAETGSAETLRCRLNIPDHVPVIGSIFRFYAEKQPLLWVEAAALVGAAKPECHFVIVGEGPLRSEALELGKRLGLDTRLHCPGVSDAAKTYLALFDIFLLTSRFEGTPNVVLEASLAGVPVVATPGGGTAEAIEDGVSGIVVPEYRPAVIADAVLEALNDAAWRMRVREAGPNFVQRRFGMERMLRETLALYGMASGPCRLESKACSRSPI